MKPIVKGFAKGYARVIREYDHKHADQNTVLDEKEELELLDLSVKSVDASIKTMIDRAKERQDETTVAIMEVHRMLLEDEALRTDLKDKIQNGQSAYTSIRSVFDMWIDTFELMDNDYMKERSTDLRDIKGSLLDALSRIKSGENDNQIVSDKELPVVLFTPELTPSQLASMDVKQLKGIVTKMGGETSHAAIMCKSLDIPMIVGSYSNDVEDGMAVLMDGVSGEIICNPDDQKNQVFTKKHLQYESFREKLRSMRSSNRSSHEELHVNLGDLDDLDKAVSADANGVGLFRTEFLFMKSDRVPSEEEQYEAYKQVLESFGDKPVTIRTIDIGGDKNLPYLDMPAEDNPFLGYRAIRMCLGTHQVLFRDQLRAILRASVHGKARIMFPMISNRQEIIEARRILAEESEKLKKEGIPYDQDIKIGIMIEVPSAALLSHTLTDHVDFFSIGTNDLTQYTMAADRMNSDVSYLYSYFEPAVLSLLQHVIESANKSEVDVSVCGEMASDPLAIPLLMAMGLEKYSVSPSRADAARYIIAQLGKENTNEMRKTLLDFAMDRDDIANQAKKYMNSKFGLEMGWL